MGTNPQHEFNVVPLFARSVPPACGAADRALVVRAFADATVSLGRAAELLDAANLEPRTKLVLMHGVKELVVRTFNLNAAYMDASGDTFRLHGRDGNA